MAQNRKMDSPILVFSAGLDIVIPQGKADQGFDTQKWYVLS